jgi:hypothetical protein
MNDKSIDNCYYPTRYVMSKHRTQPSWTINPTQKKEVPQLSLSSELTLLPNIMSDQQLSLQILQINLNKSEKVHLELLNNLKEKDWDIVLVQESHTTAFSSIRTPTNY